MTAAAVETDSNSRDVRLESSQTGVEMELEEDALMNMSFEIELVDEVLLTPTDGGDAPQIPPSQSPPQSPSPPPPPQHDVSHRESGPEPDDTRHYNPAQPPDACQTHKRVVNTTKLRMPKKNVTCEPQKAKKTKTKKKEKDVCSSKPLRKTNRQSFLLRFALPRTKKAGKLSGRKDADGARAQGSTKQDKIGAADNVHDEDGTADDFPKQITTDNAIVTQALEMNIQDVQRVMLNQMNSKSDSTILFRFDTRDYQWPSLDQLTSVLSEQCHVLQNTISAWQGGSTTKSDTPKDQTIIVSPKDDSDAATCCSDSQVCAESVGKTKKNRKLKLFPLRVKARGQNATEKGAARFPERGGSISVGSNHSLHSTSSATSKRAFNPFNLSQRSSRVSSSRSSASARSIPLPTPEPTFFGRMFDDTTNLILPQESLNPVYPGDRDGYRDSHDGDADELMEVTSVMSSEVDNVVGTIQSTAQDILSSDIEDVWLSRAVLHGIADSNKVSVEDLIETVCDKLDDLDSTLFSLDEKESPGRRWFPKVHLRAAW